MAITCIESPFITAREAAAYLGCPEQTLACWRTRGTPKLPFVKIGRKVVYRRDELEKFVSTRTATSTTEAATFAD